jgi:hypothetical protein
MAYRLSSFPMLNPKRGGAGVVPDDTHTKKMQPAGTGCILQQQKMQAD